MATCKGCGARIIWGEARGPVSLPPSHQIPARCTVPHDELWRIFLEAVYDDDDIRPDWMAVQAIETARYQLANDTRTRLREVLARDFPEVMERIDAEEIPL